MLVIITYSFVVLFQFARFFFCRGAFSILCFLYIPRMSILLECEFPVSNESTALGYSFLDIVVI